MSLRIVDFIMNDFMYKHHLDGSYIFSPDGALQWANRNDITDTVLETLKKIYSGIVTHNNVDPGPIMCNDYVLDQVFLRYSRDVFGEYRLNSKIEYLKKVGSLTETQQKNLMEFSQYGLKIDSREPYVHRKAAYLLYWFSVLKPFAIYPDDISIKKKLGLAFVYHNEYMSYLLILAMLKVLDIKLNIHESRETFSDFLYNLHFRKISRSSLEFFLGEYLVSCS